MTGVKNFSINKKNNDSLRFLVGAVVLLFFLVILNLLGSYIKNFFYVISSPVEKTFWTAGESSSTFLTSLVSAGSLEKENNKLQQENEKLLSQIAFLQAIKDANQAQSDVSISCQNDGFRLVMAGVMGLEDNDIISINKGSADGVAEGMPVISQQNVLFGKVLKVYKNFSKVVLVSNENSVINVKIQPNLDASDTTEIDGVVKGSGGLKAFLDLIPINSEINAGDTIVISSMEKAFPKDLLIGKIIEKQKNDQKPFQQAQIDLFSNISTAENLFVITNYKQPS